MHLSDKSASMYIIIFKHMGRGNQTRAISLWFERSRALLFSLLAITQQEAKMGSCDAAGASANIVVHHNPYQTSCLPEIFTTEFMVPVYLHKNKIIRIRNKSDMETDQT
jgi:hypothetical protein